MFKDGRLNRIKFESAFNSLNPKYKASNYSSYVFHAFDKDNAGFIEFPEFLTALLFLSDSGSLHDRLKFMFKVIDQGILLDISKKGLSIQFIIQI